MELYCLRINLVKYCRIVVALSKAREEKHWQQAVYSMVCVT